MFIGEGNVLESTEVNEHVLLKTVLWIHKNWRSFDDECQPTTTTTTTTKPQSTSTTSDNTNTASGKINASSVNYTVAAFVLLGMNIFTLSVWVQIKI